MIADSSHGLGVTMPSQLYDDTMSHQHDEHELSNAGQGAKIRFHAFRTEMLRSFRKIDGC